MLHQLPSGEWLDTDDRIPEEDQIIRTLAMLLAMPPEHRAEAMTVLYEPRPQQVATDARVGELLVRYEPAVTPAAVARAAKIYGRLRMAAVEAALIQFMTPRDRVNWYQRRGQGFKRYLDRITPNSVVCNLIKLIDNERRATVLHLWVQRPKSTAVPPSPG